MSKLLARLRDASRSGVYRVRSDAEVTDALRLGGLQPRKVSLKGAGTKAELLDRLAKALEFPDWFGGNWDALEDCLTDVSGYLLFYDYQKVAADDFGVLTDVLASSAGLWAERGEPFFAVFIDPERRLGVADLFRGT